MRTFLIGGYCNDVDDGKLYEWWMSLAGPKPTVCFVPTASGDSEEEIAQFTTLVGFDVGEIRILRLFKRDRASIPELLDGVDIVYVNGGNTANLLAVWKTHGADEAIRNAWDHGAVIGGVSAGALCFGSGGITDSFGNLRPMDGLDYTHDSISPHHDEDDRRERYERAVRERRLHHGYGLDNGVGALFTDGVPTEFVATNPHARAWRTTHLNVEPIVPRLL